MYTYVLPEYCKPTFVRVLKTFATLVVEYKIAKVYIREQVGLKCVRNKNIYSLANTILYI